MGTHEIVVLLGGPGSGKGTQAVRLAQLLGVPHLASGDLLRDHRQRGTELGRRAQSAMDNGDLVPDELVTTMVLQRLNEADAAGGALLDGFPRDVPQARALDCALAEHAMTLQAIYLDVSQEALAGRLSGRRTCPVCHASYHVDANPPLEDDHCDGCGAALEQRPDDCAEVVRHRIAVYVRETLPVVEHYTQLGVLRRIDGDRPIGLISAELESMTGAAS